MRSAYIFLCCFLINISSFAQTNAQDTNGKWGFTKYADNIVKITYRPTGYTTNENISDAVILKPVRILKQRGFMQFIAENGDVVKIGKGTSFELISTFTKDNYNGFQFRLTEGTKVFGGGERALSLDRKGYKFNLYNTPWYGYSEGADNLNYSVPFFTTSDGYGLFFDNASKGYADIGKTNPSIFEVGFVSGELNVYLIMGKDYKEILSTYHKLTGTQPLPPRWAFGNLMSRFGYTSQSQVTDIVRKMKQQHIPIDAVIFDLFWFGDSIKSTMGNLAWVNTTKWPDPRKMIGDLKKDNIKTILITEPFVLQTSSNYNNSKMYHAIDNTGSPYVLKDFYFGKGGLIDIFRKDAREWFWDQHKKQMSIGVEAWWGDLGEPEKHPADLYHNLMDKGFKRPFKADEVHNIYGHTWTKMLYDNYAREYPHKRLFSLNRSGFAGSQRYGIFPWSGDVSRSWSGLRAQLPIMLSMSMSGVPYIHADAGGFAGGEGDNELYVRWLQFAAFTPIFRPHGTALYEVDKNAFSFPSEAALIDEPYRGYAKETISMRYQMLPYNYTLAYKQATTGQPLVAPLYYYYPKDTVAANIGDEFMWGENILVAPVLEKGAKERKVYLPEGKWYFGTKVKDGGHFYSDTLVMTRIPSYIKAGSIIPTNTGLSGNNAAANKSDSLVIRYYVSDIPTSYTLYQDDGIDKHSIQDKKYELITIDARPSANKIDLTIFSNNYNYAGKPSKRSIKIIIIDDKTSYDKRIFVNGKYSDLDFKQPKEGEVEYAARNVYSANFDLINAPVTIQLKDD